MDALSKFGEHGTKSSQKKNPQDKYEAPIYGPKTEKVPEPSPASKPKKPSPADTTVYPDIYGPEITPVPGKKVCHGGSNSSDCASGDAYEYNPDLKNAFPTDGDEPQPFLTDFSKIQH